MSSGAIPPGLTFSSNGTAGARISGTPSQAGSFTFYVTIHNPYREDPPGTVVCNGDYSDKKFTIPIVPGLPKLTLGPESTAAGTTGAPYSLQMTSTVSDAKTWSISSGALPPGLAIEVSSGLISGTPTTSGTYSFTVYAKVNTDSRSDTKALSIVVRDALALTTSEPFVGRRAQGEVHVPFEATFAAMGGSGTYTWSLAAGSVPPGLRFANGAITGTPKTPGGYPFVVSVADTEGRRTNYTARIVVAGELKITTTLLRTAKVGKLYGAKLRTSGGVAATSWRVSGRLPHGIRFDRTRGTLTGRPNKAGRYHVTFAATDALGVVSKKGFRLFVGL